MAKAFASNSSISGNLSDEREDSLPTQDEYGSPIKVSSLDINSSPAILATTITEGATDHKWIPPRFTWDNTQDYTIGYNHIHLDDLPPSPVDIDKLAEIANNLTDAIPATTSGITINDLNYFKKNAITIVGTPDYTYAITVSNWNDFLTDAATAGALTQSQYEAKLNAYYNDTHNKDQADAQLYVLNQLYGNSITISRSPYSSTASDAANNNFQPIIFSGTSNSLKTNCP